MLAFQILVETPKVYFVLSSFFLSSVCDDRTELFICLFYDGILCHYRNIFLVDCIHKALSICKIVILKEFLFSPKCDIICYKRPLFQGKCLST